jgi:hypothetical protein
MNNKSSEQSGAGLAASTGIGERGEDIAQDPECFCPRCIAVRALRPNDKLTDRPE